MRHIDLNGARPPTGWVAQALRASAEVSAMPIEERAEEIAKRSSVWAAVKRELARLSEGKCWYCEAREARSDNSVDHYRPKGRVHECPTHEGYWWLAFEWSNLRFSCTYCNSARRSETTGGGKQDHFPLLDEATRVHDSSVDVSREACELLDPACPGDPALLSFSENGEAVARWGTERPVLSQRAQTSIRILHLNHPDIVELRYVLCQRVRELVSAGDRLFEKYGQGDGTAAAGMLLVARQLMDLIKPQAEFSVAAKASLMGFRDRPWVEAFLQVA